MATDLAIPSGLINQIREGNVVLFLGAGASMGAKHPQNKRIPTGQELSNQIADKFLDASYNGMPLQYVSDLAISERDLFSVQKLLYDIFTKFEPADFQIKIASFFWRAIYTTNYDFLIEDAYRKAKQPLQKLVPVIKNTPVEEIYIHEYTLPYFKLHGCLSEINNINLPLILTPDQYNSHKQNRQNLFSKFLEDAKNHTILFVGYSMADLDIRDVIARLDELKDARPRSYILAPGLKDADIRLWGTKKITAIVATFQEFLEKIDKEIDITTRSLVKIREVFDQAIFSKFVVSPKEKALSEALSEWLKHDVDFIHTAMPSESVDPKQFYKGYLGGWEPIINNYDVERMEKDDILASVFLDDYYSGGDNPFFFLIEGNAGSGKSVFLRRLAWDAGISFDKTCLFLKANASIKYDLIHELYDFLKSRIYIFIDGVKERSAEIMAILDRSKKDRIPITIFGTERTNVWYSDCKTLSPYLTNSFDLHYLQPKEIVGLLALLEKHKSLGYLENKSNDERIHAFSYKAGRDLLVALYEATNGKPFEEIIFDEYNQINSTRAQSLYLTVSIFHRQGTYARAGLISRVHDISFSDFKTKLFDPLKFIVFDKMNYHINDYVYSTRHREIANIVFERVLNTQQSRFDEFARLLSHLDTDYQSDKIVFLSLVNADNLLKSFNDQKLVRNLYDLAEDTLGDDKRLKQQRAIYELKSEGGSIRLASELINEAIDLCKDEYDPIIQHTAAEIEYKRAELSQLKQDAEKHLRKCISICDKILKHPKQKTNAFAYHTKIKAMVLQLKITIEEGDAPSIERMVKDIEKIITAAKILHINQEFILEAEAKFNEAIDNTPTAVTLLEQAFDINKSSPYLALKLASIYFRRNSNLDKAIAIIKTTLSKLSGDKDLNYYMGYYLSQKEVRDLPEILFHFRKSFTSGDSRISAQFEFAKFQYLDKNYQEAKNSFAELEKIRLDPKVRNEVRDVIKQKGQNIIFTGVIKKKDAYFGFIKREIEGDEIYFDRYGNVNVWDTLLYNDKVTFNIGFNYRGPVAVNVKKV